VRDIQASVEMRALIGMRAVAGELTRRNTASKPGEHAGGLAAARHPARGCPA
jgi:hypothetical protein